MEPDAAAVVPVVPAFVPVPLPAAVEPPVLTPVVDDAGRARSGTGRHEVARRCECEGERGRHRLRRRAPRRAVAVTTWVDAELSPLFPAATSAPMPPPTRDHRDHDDRDDSSSAASAHPVPLVRDSFPVIQDVDRESQRRSTRSLTQDLGAAHGYLTGGAHTWACGRATDSSHLGAGAHVPPWSQPRTGAAQHRPRGVPRRMGGGARSRPGRENRHCSTSSACSTTPTPVCTSSPATTSRISVTVSRRRYATGGSGSCFSRSSCCRARARSTTSRRRWSTGRCRVTNGRNVHTTRCTVSGSGTGRT